MKYKYQDTEIIVESSNKLDSTFFKPIEEVKDAEKPKDKVQKRVARNMKKRGG